MPDLHVNHKVRSPTNLLHQQDHPLSPSCLEGILVPAEGVSLNAKISNHSLRCGAGSYLHSYP